jgi:hypothetical protein
MAIKMTLSTILQLYHSDSSIEHLLYIIDLKDLLCNVCIRIYHIPCSFKCTSSVIKYDIFSFPFFNKSKLAFWKKKAIRIYSVDITIYNSIISHMSSIFKAIGEESCRKTVYVEAKRLKSFVTENVVELQSVDNELNESETINILTQLCKYTDVEIKLFEKMSFTSARVMFPFLCKLFSLDIKSFDSSPIALKMLLIWLIILLYIVMSTE